MNYTKEDVESFLSCPLEHATIVKVERLSSDLLAWREIAEKLHGELVKEVGPGCGMKDCKNEYCQLLAAYDKAVQS